MKFDDALVLIILFLIPCLIILGAAFEKGLFE